MVKKYSLSLDGAKKITPHFRVAEVACHDGSDMILMDSDTIDLLEKVRAYYREIYPGATVVINSGYRTPSYNRRIGGATHSQHVQGRACDFTVRKPNAGTVSPYEVYKALNDGTILGHSHKGGLGRYATFTHIDTGSKRRWKG